MIKHSRIRICIAVTAVLIGVTLFAPALPVAAGSFFYQFLPNSFYTPGDIRVTLHIFDFNGSPYPSRVDWFDPQGAQVSCIGGQGVCWDQQVADNGALVWKNFYLPIAGYQRPSGYYLANVYSYQSGSYTLMFSGNFSIEQPPVTNGAELDPAFGVGGKVTTDFGGEWSAGEAVAVQTDGKIVVAGIYAWGYSQVDYFALARYNRDGSLDTGFGSGGKVITDFGGQIHDDRANSVALQTDGKIVVAGEGIVGISPYDYLLVRYNSNGSLDTGFGAGGKVTTDFGGDDDGYSVALQTDGKIVVAGSSRGANNASYFSLARYNSDGSLDTGFGAGGKVTTEFDAGWAGGHAVALQTDGKIVVAGYSSDSYYSAVDFALARYNRDGSLDTGFGSGGKVTTDFGGQDYAFSVALQVDGKIVVTGSRSISPAYYFVLARYNRDGSLDTGFGTAGKVITGFGDYNSSNSVVLQADGMIVVAGFSCAPIPILTCDFALARYNRDGGLDTSFGVGGKATTRFVGGAQGNAAAVQVDGKIVVAGVAGDRGTFALVRYVAAPPPRMHFYVPLIFR
jgi:uncharacterized delta-60 repeat protein